MHSRKNHRNQGYDKSKECGLRWASAGGLDHIAHCALPTVIAAFAARAATSAFGAATVKTLRQNEIAASMPLVAASADPVIHRVLNEDFYAARRAGHVDAKAATAKGDAN